MIILGLGCMAALSFTSCLNDDDNDNSGLTKAEISQCLAAVVGNYSGKMIYAAKNADNLADTQDTLDINWTVNTDTMLIVKALPAKVVAESIWDSELKAALQEQNPVQDLKCQMAFVLNDPYIEFILGPQKVDYPVFYKEQSHTLSIYFWANYSYGDKDPSSNLMVLRLAMGAAYLDNDEKTNHINSYGTEAVTIPFLFTTAL